MAEMSAQIRQLTATVAKLAARGQQNTENDNPNKNQGPCSNRIVEKEAPSYATWADTAALTVSTPSAPTTTA
jgi:Flp pilus assembly protein TadG